jgi:hypothetical protein
MSTPEIIYLIPGEDIEGYPGMVWCDDPAPDSYSDPAVAVKYVRADTLPVVTDNGKVNAGLIAENERLQARVAALNGLIETKQGRWVTLDINVPWRLTGLNKKTMRRGDGAYASVSEHGDLIITANHNDPSQATDAVYIDRERVQGQMRIGNGKPGDTLLRNSEKVYHFAGRMVAMEQER